MIKKFILPVALLTCLSVFFGCQTEQDLREQRAANARKDYYHIVRQYMPSGKRFTLPECIEEALKNNLDMQVYDLKERIENERKTATILGMLPDVQFGYDITARDNDPGSSSYNIFTDEESLTPSRSSSRTESNKTIDIALSVIDFGLAYFNSVQAQDKRLIVAAQKRRVAQDLIFKVVKKYLDVASAQHAINATNEMLDRTGKIEKILTELQESKKLSPLVILDEKKRFISLEKRLKTYYNEYENSCIQLKALMGYTPNSMIMVDDGFLDSLNELELPNVRALERIALQERPELFEVDYRQHISVIEARKAIVKMFPSARIFADYTDSSNKYLYNDRWWTLGMRAAYDLLSIPAHVFEYQENVRKADAMDQKMVALSLAVMSQVHMAYASIIEAKKIYELDNKVYQAYDEQLQVIRKIYDSGEDYSKLDLDRLELETADTKINRAFALGSYYLAYYRLMNTIGIDSLDPNLLRKKVKKIQPELNPAKNNVAAK